MGDVKSDAREDPKTSQDLDSHNFQSLVVISSFIHSVHLLCRQSCAERKLCSVASYLSIRDDMQTAMAKRKPHGMGTVLSMTHG